MLTIRTILHPTDFSERSEFAFELACTLARDYDAALLVLHVMTPPATFIGGSMAIPPPWDEEEELREKLLKLEPKDPGVRISRLMTEGIPDTEIVRVAAECQCDLIVMGTHGWTGLSRLLMGSVAEHVVRKATCPVLTVRTPFAEIAPKNAATANARGATVVVAS